MLDRDPYAVLPDLPTFTLTSSDVQDGQPMPAAQVTAGLGGADQSPQLSWSGAPEGTKSYVVTCFDPDAPTPSGYWHWCVSNIPAEVTTLEAGAAAAPPDGSTTHRTDGGSDGYEGAAPPPGHGAHRYIFCVTAVDTEHLDVEGASPAVVNFNLFFHGLGRALLTGTHEETAD